MVILILLRLDPLVHQHLCAPKIALNIFKLKIAEGIGFHALFNYCGGAFSYVRREYAGAIRTVGRTAEAANVVLPCIAQSLLPLI